MPNPATPVPHTRSLFTFIAHYDGGVPTVAQVAAENYLVGKKLVVAHIAQLAADNDCPGEVFIDAAFDGWPQYLGGESDELRAQLIQPS